ncbi:MAG: MATE family efflux transporter [Bacteroidetes bacterium]|nr:MATE family efflux transporter [Bacteroidota bacterium]MCL2303163.1 MATE family efflux transporter [Lentimicrobiaceae bacterium]
MPLKKLLPYYKRNLALALPIILAQLGQVTVSIVDTFMVGMLGTIELAAVAFASSIFMLVFIFGLGFSLGQTPHVGKAYGKKQWWKIGVFFQNALLINISLSVILFGVVFLLKPLLYHLNQPENVVEMAMPYFDWMLFSTMPILLFFTCRQFAEGVGNTKIAMWVTILGNILNIILNYALIFGKFGFPALGIEGAGIATFIVRTVMALAFVFLVFKHPALKRFTQHFSWKNFHISALKRLITTGFPISGQLVVEVSVISFSAIMIGWINEVNLAAHQIAIQLSSATFMIGLGVGSANTILVSHQFGANQFKATRMTALAALHLVTVFMIITAVFFIVLRYQIPSWFSSDPEVIYVAAQLLVIVGIFQLFDGWQMVGLGTLRGLTDVTFAMYIAIISYLVISLPVGYIFGFIWGLGSVGVWIGLCVGLMVAAVAYRLRFLYFMKKY